MQQSVEESSSFTRPTLPPIHLGGPNISRDQEFVIDLVQNVTQELEKLEHHTYEGLHKQRYPVFQDAFGQLVWYLSGYCPILTAVKAEFEDCINTIERGKQEAFYLSAKVRTMVAEQTTLNYYNKRADHLKQIIRIIESNNEQLNLEMEATLGKLNTCLQIPEEEAVMVKAKKPNVPERLVPGLTLEESVDIDHLHKQISSLEERVKDLHHAKRTRYTPRDQKNVLKMQLASKSKAKNNVSEKNAQLKTRCRKLRVAMDALKVYCKDPPQGQTPAEAIIHALTRSNSKMSSRSGDVTSSTFDDDDPNKEREAEMLLEYIEHFNELFEEGKYREAAMHAANSPKGILRNSETLSRFRAIHVRPGKPSPLLGYCEALMSSTPAVGTLPNAETSLECVKSALMEDRLDLVMHWLSQNRLTCSEPLGHLLYNYTKGKMQGIVGRCLPLAEAVYAKVGAHIQTAVCMCKQGKVQAMMDYATSADFEKDMYLGVLVACPSVVLAEVLVQPRVLTGRPTLSIGTVVGELLRTENHDIGIQLLDKIYHTTKSGTSSASVRDLVFCDPDTDSDTWVEIINRCQDSGLYDLGLELLAALTVLRAIRIATSTVSLK